MKGVRVLPVVNGRFECEIPVEHEDDYYVLIPWNQWARRSFRHIELFAEAGDVKICWHQDSIPVIQGKELNWITGEADGYAQSVKNEYYPLLSQMTEEEGHYLPEVKALFEKNGDGNRL